MNVGDGLEFLGNLGAFWRFVFSARFRGTWLNKFARARRFDRFMMAVEGAVATFCGVILPVAVLVRIAA
ncbi:MAG TPA: hypothetical protein VF092_09975 [Longimicrobium sp.]